MFGKNIKNKLEDLLEEKIQVFFQNKAKESKILSNTDFEMLYVNSVTIRFYKDRSFNQDSELNDNFFNPNGNFEKFEQKFRINSQTTFDELKKFAWEFWGEPDEGEYLFYDEKLNDIFVDSEFQSRNYQNITVNKFFEMFQFTTAVLVLK